MKLSSNMGDADRLIRLLFAAVFIGNGIYFGWYLLIGVGAVLLATAVLSFCPIYGVLRTNTKNLPHAEI